MNKKQILNQLQEVSKGVVAIHKALENALDLLNKEGQEKPVSKNEPVKLFNVAKPKRAVKLSPFDMKKAGIKVGDTLRHVKYTQYVVVVTGNKTVRFDNETKNISLSEAACEIAHRQTGANHPALRGPAYFTWGGRLLSEIKEGYINKSETLRNCRK